jgi:hypothetical protein
MGEEEEDHLVRVWVIQQKQVFLFRPIINIRQNIIAEYSAENEYSAVHMLCTQIANTQAFYAIIITLFPAEGEMNILEFGSPESPWVDLRP